MCIFVIGVHYKIFLFLLNSIFSLKNKNYVFMYKKFIMWTGIDWLNKNWKICKPFTEKENITQLKVR